MLSIYFLYADNCEHCVAALGTINDAIKSCKNISCEIKKFRYDTPEALNIAIDNGIDDLPGFVIGNESFKGSNYTEESIVKAIRKYGKVSHNT